MNSIYMRHRTLELILGHTGGRPALLYAGFREQMKCSTSKNTVSVMGKPIKKTMKGLTGFGASNNTVFPVTYMCISISNINSC